MQISKLLIFWTTIILATSISLSASAAASLPKTSKDMEAAHGADAVAIKDAVLVAVSSSPPLERDVYARSIVKEFRIELDSKNPDARLNTAIIFAELEVVSCDFTLETMLANKDDSVRLWGAKGLAAIAPEEKKIGGATLASAIKSLKDARAVEKSGTVITELDKALSSY